MKAVRVHQLGGPEVLMLEEVPEIHPGPKQLVIDVKAIGVNPVEVYTRAGTYSKTAVPYTPGTDAAGVVKSVGAGPRKFKVGDRVFVSGSLTGTYAEEALCEEHQAHPLPEKLSFSQGAAIGVPYSTAYRALFQMAEAKAGETVLVHGATGGVGTATLQLARLGGLKVIATGSTESGRKMALGLGATAVLDHSNPSHLDEIQSLTSGHGIDIVIEMLANVNLDRDLKALAMRGRVVVVGSRGRIEIEPRDAMRRDAAILGMLVANAPKEDLGVIFSDLSRMLSRGDLVPVVGEEIPLSRAPVAHERVMMGGARGKIVLIP